MKSSTSRSVFPSRRSSRMRFLRSIASVACESASVWFWHTRQRSSSASAMTRFSRIGSSATGEAANADSVIEIASKTKASLRTLQLLHQRQDALAHDLGSKDADALVADDALAVDDEGFGYAVDAVVHAQAPLSIVQRKRVGVAEAPEPGERLVGFVLVVEPDDRRGAGARERRECGMLLAARHAPRGPYVQDPHFAGERVRGDALFGRAQRRQLERWRLLADERRRQLARVERQSRAEERRGDAEECERNEAPAVQGRDLLRVASTPPAAMRSVPSQIHPTKGLCCRRTTHSCAESGSPSAT